MVGWRSSWITWGTRGTYWDLPDRFRCERMEGCPVRRYGMQVIHHPESFVRTVQHARSRFRHLPLLIPRQPHREAGNPKIRSKPGVGDSRLAYRAATSLDLAWPP